MNILITGANGFIGNAVSNYFFVQNHHVIRWVKKNDKGEGKAVRLEDWASVLENLKSISPDIIIHCAGAANVQDSIKRPNEDFINNVQATHNLIFAMKKLEMRSRLVFIQRRCIWKSSIFASE